ncbi:PREDICTED: uncharacterized protein LOC104822601 isoform X2 [Tarenaya hassleriana]|uniref:uncharacterized protein LOC104822601 isoform X1 n=1 Tax=Tarenaya hassleriana TaxID=28532 RepID=UPI00053C9151|nr:PREDICTED: uncharacterized protein LOC104822601 isoform X1 [Tarenaya hassleriana]XP_010552169.1 PREDICTED: uncharacterized protein LOC104822601 isoform X2 [Tarenaya hassleriana]
MRGAIGRRLPNPNGYNLASVANQSPFLIRPTSHFSSSSSGGHGRGRGRGAATGDGGLSVGRGQFDFSQAPGNPSEPENPKRDSPEPPPSVGHGHGRGRPIGSDPISPAFSSFVSSIRPVSPGVGRGRGAAGPAPGPSFSADSPPPPPPPGEQPPQPPKQPIFVKLQEIKESTASESGKVNLPSDIFGALGSENLHSNRANVFGSGAGRGKPATETGPAQQVQEENRHIRRAQAQQQQRFGKSESQGSPRHAVRRGRGRERGRGIGSGRGGNREGWRDGKSEEEIEAEAMSVFVGDNADGEKFAKRVGPERMDELMERFEEICDDVLPDTAMDAYVDAYETNLMIECEPEYLMADFESNPDIDEKPPMSLRDCLEKVKPFIMSYEGIQSQEEWEEAINEVMERAPLIKEIVDHYSGPDRVTAKKQNEELERVAKTLPQSAPDSVKRFTDRAVLTLQSNPGWGFDRKCQFMDKLVWEVSQQYK